MRSSQTQCSRMRSAQVAAELSGEAQLVTILPVQGPANNQFATKRASQAGPGHLYLCGHACILGAMHATEKATQQLFSEPADFAQVWQDEFKGYTQVLPGSDMCFSRYTHAFLAIHMHVDFPQHAYTHTSRTHTQPALQ